MRYKHFALEIDFVYFVPAKMLRSFAGHKCANARIIYADVLLRTAVILDRVPGDSYWSLRQDGMERMSCEGRPG